MQVFPAQISTEERLAYKLERADRLEAEAQQLRREVRTEALAQYAVRLCTMLEQAGVPSDPMHHEADQWNMNRNLLISEARALAAQE